MHMTKLYFCRHQLALLTRAVKAYQPTSDEKVEHEILVNILEEKSEEAEPLRPEDIPY